MGHRELRRPAICGWALALFLYLTAAAVLVGRQALADPTHVCMCVGPNGDPPFFMWALKWWPYAISHQVNPFYTNVVWYPGGANIATTTGIPGVALALWPVTSQFGPIVAYDVAALLSPVLAAQAAYALCRHLTGRYWPSVVGGFVYGFSSYELGQLTSHLQVALVFLLPLIPLLILRRHAGQISRRRFVVILAAVLAAQVLLSTEIIFDVVLLGAIALLTASALTPAEGRRRLLALTGEIVAAGLLGAAAVSPYLYWAVIKGGVANYGAVVGTVFAERYRLDPLNLVVPTQLTLVGGHALRSVSTDFDGGNPVEAGGYLGLPVLLLLGAFALATWRRASTRFLLVMFAVVGILALGPRLSQGSDTLIPLPWRLVENAPAFKAILPTRFVLFLALIAAVGVALELARRRRRPWLAWLMVLAGIVAVLPTQRGASWHSRTPRPPLALTSAKRYLPATGSVLMVPVGQYGSSMYWQGDSDFDFRLANGRVALVLPPEYNTEPASLFMANSIGPPRRAWLAAFLLTHQVTSVVVGPASLARWDPALRRLRLHARDVAGFAVYYVCGPPSANACGRLAGRPAIGPDVVMG